MFDLLGKFRLARSQFHDGMSCGNPCELCQTLDSIEAVLLKERIRSALNDPKMTAITQRLRVVR